MSRTMNGILFLMCCCGFISCSNAMGINLQRILQGSTMLENSVFGLVDKNTTANPGNETNERLINSKINNIGTYGQQALENKLRILTMVKEFMNQLVTELPPKNENAQIMFQSLMDSVVNQFGPSLSFMSNQTVPQVREIH